MTTNADPLNDEIERLRAALRAIEDIPPYDALAEAQIIAHDALNFQQLEARK